MCLDLSGKAFTITSLEINLSGEVLDGLIFVRLLPCRHSTSYKWKGSDRWEAWSETFFIHSRVYEDNLVEALGAIESSSVRIQSSHCLCSTVADRRGEFLHVVLDHFTSSIEFHL